MKAINHFKNETGKVSEVERAYGSGHANSEGRLVLQSEGARVEKNGDCCSFVNYEQDKEAAATNPNCTAEAPV